MEVADQGLATGAGASTGTDDVHQKIGSLTRQLHTALNELGFADPLRGSMGELPDAQQLKVVQALQASLDGLDANWLARIESAQRADPRNARLLYLSAMACLQRELWGKAQQLFTQAAQQLADAPLRASAWRHLAQLAEQRADADAAAHAWKQAALQYP